MQNTFQGFSEDDEEDDGTDFMSWPVVGQGGKVNKGGKGKFGKGAKFKKFANTSNVEDVRFAGAVDQGGDQVTMGLCFQVTDVRKPLVAVKRMAEKCDVVQFGPLENDQFIKNRLTWGKLFLKKKKGSSIIMVCPFGVVGVS